MNVFRIENSHDEKLICTCTQCGSRCSCCFDAWCTYKYMKRVYQNFLLWSAWVRKQTMPWEILRTVKTSLKLIYRTWTMAGCSCCFSSSCSWKQMMFWIWEMLRKYCESKYRKELLPKVEAHSLKDIQYSEHKCWLLYRFVRSVKMSFTDMLFGTWTLWGGSGCFGFGWTYERIEGVSRNIDSLKDDHK